MDQVFLSPAGWLRAVVVLLWLMPAVAGRVRGEAPYWFWSKQQDLPAGQDGPRDDADKDRHSNLEEYFFGTNPLHPDSRGRLVCRISPAGEIVLSYRASKQSEGVEARLLESASLASPAWLPLSAGSVEVSSVDGGAEKEIRVRLDRPPGGMRFYRLQLEATDRSTVSSHDFGQWHPVADGVADDGPKFRAFFERIKNEGGGRVRIPAGTYGIDISLANQCPVPSNVEIDATGAVFQFSETVGAGTLFTWLQDTNVVNFAWKGGRFVGRAFDLGLIPHTANTWHPNAHIRCVHLSTSPGGRTANILFEGVETFGMQGTTLTVAGKLANYYTVDTFAENVTLRRCRFVRSGPFLWDYGFIWQLVVWDYEYDDNHRSLGRTYLDPRIFTAPVRAQGTRVEFDNSAGLVEVSGSSDLGKTVCFYGDQVDSHLVRGIAYHVVDSDASHIKVSGRPNGTPILFQGDGVNMKIMYNIFHAFLALLAPAGSAWIPDGQGGHGTFMVDAAIGVRAQNNRLEQCNGDAMLIRHSRDVDFSWNEIAGARMGAVWIGDLCENVLVQGNWVDGGNGSRVLSVERSSKDVVVSDNYFYNGGRGTWINAPRGILLSNNFFYPNTGKNTPDPYLGRRSYQTGGYELWDQIYFTTHAEPPYGADLWGPVVIVDNVIDSGPGPVPAQCLRIHQRARDVYIARNAFVGQSRYFLIDPLADRVAFGPNTGILTTNGGRYVQTVLDYPVKFARIPHGLADNSPFLSCVPSITPNNPDSQATEVNATDSEIILTFPAPVPVGRTIDLDWSAYLKWK